MRNLQHPGRSPVAAPNGMASTSHPLSTQAALNILQQGGNALDAAIAASGRRRLRRHRRTRIACLGTGRRGQRLLLFWRGGIRWKGSRFDCLLLFGINGHKFLVLDAQRLILDACARVRVSRVS